MLWFFIQSFIGLLIAFLLGAILGYLYWRLRFRKIRTLVSSSSQVSNLSGSGGLSANIEAKKSASPTVSLTIDAEKSRLALERATEESAAHAAKSSQLQNQLAALQAEHEKVLITLRNEHAGNVATLRNEHEAAFTTLRNDHTGMIAGLGNEHEAAIKSLHAEHDQKLSAVHGDVERSGGESLRAHEGQLGEVDRAHREQLSSVRNEHERALEAARQERLIAVEALQAAQVEHAAQLASTRADAETGLLAARRDHEQQLVVVSRDLDRLTAATKTEHDHELAELRSHHDNALATVSAENQRRLSDVQSAHEAVTALKGQSDTQLAELRAQHDAALQTHQNSLGDLRRRAESAEAHLARVRNEHDQLQNELGARTQLVQQHVVQLDAHRQQIEAHQTELADHRNDAANQVKLFEDHRDNAARELKIRDLDIEQRAAMAVAQTKEYNSMRENLSFSQTEVLRLRQKVAEIEGTAASSAALIARRENEMASLRQDHAGKVQEIASLRAVATQTPDDLTTIEGVGPAFDKALRADGIDSFAKLRDCDENRLRSSIQKAGLTYAPSLPTWSRQAAYLAVGDHTGFRTYQEFVVAGQEPGDTVAGPATNVSVDPGFAERRATVRQVTDLTFDNNPNASDQLTVNDNLELVEGIGPKIADALQAAGIRSYRRLAIVSETRLRSALEQAGLKLAPSLPTWSQQARLLRDGDETGFRSLVERLIAGRTDGGNGRGNGQAGK